jgi:hypothetical protein
LRLENAAAPSTKRFYQWIFPPALMALPWMSFSAQAPS